jgi:hypothetical protein
MTRLEIVGWGEVSGRGAWLQPCRKAVTGSIQCGMKVEPQISPLRYALSKNISRKGPQNRRSLGFARDDKGEGDLLWKVVSEPKNASVQQPLSMKPLPFPLSSRAKPRDLRFCGPFLEMFFDSVAEWRDLRFPTISPYEEKAGRTYGP